MNTRLRPPPKQTGDAREWQQFHEAAWQHARATVQVLTDAGGTAIGSGTSYAAVPLLTAARSYALPSTEGVEEGAELVVQDEGNTGGTWTITLTAAAGDAIRGPATITTNYGRRRLIRRPGFWYSA